MGKSLITDEDITEVVGTEMFKCSRKQPMHTGRSRALAGCFTGETENISDSRKQENYDQMERTTAVILN